MPDPDDRRTPDDSGAPGPDDADFPPPDERWVEERPASGPAPEPVVEAPTVREPVDEFAVDDEAVWATPPGVRERWDDNLQIRDDEDRSSVLRVPTFSPLAVVLGWVVAWGAIAIATAILERVGVPTGLNLGIAEGGPGDSGFWAGIWALIVSGGGFLLGGYTAGRMARANGTRHAVLVWALAMLATGADAIIENIRDGTEGVVQLIAGVPFWSETGLSDRFEATLVLLLFAGASLVGAFMGGALGQAANRLDRTDNAVIRA